MFDKNITIFNKKYDKEKRTDIYKRTVIYGVHAETIQKSEMKDKETIAKDTMFISIPFSIAGYLKPNQYQDLEEITNQWTLQDGDIIVIGIVENDIDNPKYLKHLDDVYTIDSVETIDYSVSCLNHFEVYSS